MHWWHKAATIHLKIPRKSSKRCALTLILEATRGCCVGVPSHERVSFSPAGGGGRRACRRTSLLLQKKKHNTSSQQMQVSYRLPKCIEYLVRVHGTSSIALQRSKFSEQKVDRQAKAAACVLTRVWWTIYLFGLSHGGTCDPLPLDVFARTRHLRVVLRASYMIILAAFANTWENKNSLKSPLFNKLYQELSCFSLSLQSRTVEKSRLHIIDSTFQCIHSSHHTQHENRNMKIKDHVYAMD